MKSLPSAAASTRRPILRNITRAASTCAAIVLVTAAALTFGAWRESAESPASFSTRSPGGSKYRVSLPGRGANNYAVLYEADRLARMGLRYQWGSANPARGGLDCSGFVMAIYKKVYGVDLPDESNKQWEWMKTRGRVWDATSNWTPGMLQPGDLVFYSGTIDNGRSHPVTHVMIWCGGDVVAGAQHSGPRLDGRSGGGVAYFPQGAYDPKGDPAKPLAWYRGVGRIYGYARFAPSSAERENERRFVAALSGEDDAAATKTAAAPQTPPPAPAQKPAPPAPRPAVTPVVTTARETAPAAPTTATPPARKPGRSAAADASADKADVIAFSVPAPAGGTGRSLQGKTATSLQAAAEAKAKAEALAQEQLQQQKQARQAAYRRWRARRYNAYNISAPGQQPAAAPAPASGSAPAAAAPTPQETPAAAAPTPSPAPAEAAPAPASPAPAAESAPAPAP